MVRMELFAGSAVQLKIDWLAADSLSSYCDWHFHYS